MRIQTLLNRVEKFKSFVYGKARLEERDAGPALVVQVLPRKNSRPFCSGCGRPGPAYDRLEPRHFEFVPLWDIMVYLAYRMRRVDCRRCGVTVEMVPWCDGKNQLTTSYRWFLATWAKRLSWSEVASIFRTSWDSVFRAVGHAVAWGLAYRDLSGVTALGIDEVAWSRGHRYLTLVYDLGGDARRLLAVTEDRTEASLRSCLEGLGEAVCKGVRYVCSDMWKPYLNVIAEHLGQAVHVLWPSRRDGGEAPYRDQTRAVTAPPLPCPAGRRSPMIKVAICFHSSSGSRPHPLPRAQGQPSRIRRARIKRPPPRLGARCTLGPDPALSPFEPVTTWMMPPHSTS